MIQKIITTLKITVLATFLLTAIGLYTHKIVVEQVVVPHYVNVVDETGKVLFPILAGNSISYRLTFQK